MNYVKYVFVFFFCFFAELSMIFAYWRTKQYTCAFVHIVSLFPLINVVFFPSGKELDSHMNWWIWLLTWTITVTTHFFGGKKNSENITANFMTIQKEKIKLKQYRFRKNYSMMNEKWMMRLAKVSDWFILVCFFTRQNV